MSERLTDAELHELEYVIEREPPKTFFNAPDGISLRRERLLPLLSEVRASRELLAKLEWGGDELGVSSCPSCHAYALVVDERGEGCGGQHKPGCALARLLGR